MIAPLRRQAVRLKYLGNVPQSSPPNERGGAFRALERRGEAGDRNVQHHPGTCLLKVTRCYMRQLADVLSNNRSGCRRRRGGTLDISIALSSLLMSHVRSALITTVITSFVIPLLTLPILCHHRGIG